MATFNGLSLNSTRCAAGYVTTAAVDDTAIMIQGDNRKKFDHI